MLLPAGLASVRLCGGCLAPRAGSELSVCGVVRFLCVAARCLSRPPLLCGVSRVLRLCLVGLLPLRCRGPPPRVWSCRGHPRLLRYTLPALCRVLACLRLTVCGVNCCSSDNVIAFLKKKSSRG